jgi:hypothetical protein
MVAQFGQGDAMALLFPDESFDAAVMALCGCAAAHASMQWFLDSAPRRRRIGYRMRWSYVYEEAVLQ